MPLYNQTGEPLPLLSEQERHENEIMAGIYWPRDQEYISHMTPTNLRKWLYSIDPKEALILTSTHGISDRIKRQLSYKRFSIITDWLWRLWH